MWRRGWLYQSIALLVFILVRVAFWIWNREFLEVGDASLFEIGRRAVNIDWVAATWVCLPTWFFLLIGRERVGRFFWGMGLSCALALEVIDVGFFPYTHRRSGPELIQMLSFWQDTLPALGKYVRDFLAGFLFWGALVGGICIFLRFLPFSSSPSARMRWLGWLGSIGFLVLSARGGLRLKPLLVIDAAIEGCSSCTPFVLNTTFFFLRSLDQPALPPWPEMPPRCLSYPRPWKADSTYAVAPRYNIVLFLLESFSQEYVDEGYAPFLRELLRRGRAVRWGFATNSRSSEGVPAILSSIPSFGEEPVLFTSYASRIQNSLAEILRGWGYTTVFFHGGNDGTMALDSYARQAGFMQYFGRRSYPKPEQDYDGTWGIWDGPFLQFFADRLDSLPQPFLAVIFTLSSHHPYVIPKELADSFPPGPLPIHRAVRYTDWALQR
ncbi:MAG: sulfatase-like hydrolase/transferase, partial [Bacteroidia bacterium]|nr:sulfatase-like hydrolase/transferase [Bacteroidia bacterium]